MDNLIVRPAKPADALQVAKVHVATWQCAYKGLLPENFLEKLSVEEKEKIWVKNFQTPETQVQTFVAEKDGQILGFASAGPTQNKDIDKKVGELWSIYVEPNYVNQGTGSALLKTSLEYLRSQGFEQAVLWVLTSNTKTRKWYENKGWKVERGTKEETKHGVKTSETRYKINLN